MSPRRRPSHRAPGRRAGAASPSRSTSGRRPTAARGRTAGRSTGSRATPKESRAGGGGGRAKGGARPRRAAPGRRGPADPREITRLVEAQDWNSLVPLIERAGFEAGPALARLRRYAALIVAWNRGVSNIVSRRDEPRLVERHLAESLAPAHWLAGCGPGRWLDFGSGAGFPAIPLAILGLGSAWTLVEARRTKTLFLRKTLLNIDLPNIEVLNSRLETLAIDSGWLGKYLGFTSRATMPLGPTLALAAPFVAAGGHAFLWKGSGGEREMQADAGWRSSWRNVGTLRIGDGPTSVIRFLRVD